MRSTCLPIKHIVTRIRDKILKNELLKNEIKIIVVNKFYMKNCLVAITKSKVT